MKVTIENSDELRIDYSPWLVAIALIAFTLVFVGVGLAILIGGEVLGGIMFIVFGGGTGAFATALFTERTQIWADRRTGSFVLRRRTVLGSNEISRSLADVARAETETSRGGKNGPTHRPVIVMQDGERIPLRSAYVSGGDAARVTAVINRWLDRGAP